ncbi:MAG: Phosphate regulon transcriptional regulatory protein PhoB [Candidatus Scalindua arabica]|uniref:Phosphate regulon transcriptional regulatory protein PhoB n=1 Tax=Candidatus Scalindua arabica TaxID=1127984 RepID=A0A941W2G3_9BACT|nr:Phosphate regulon transcriptional regulatory protein PhoB [Candidatus Scalindua arabica]
MKKNIMIVEDEQRYHDLYSLMLEDTDYKIIHAYDGDDAFQRLDERLPDLIILDIMLDMVTGDTFFLYVKGIPKFADIPIIVLSNSARRNYKNLNKIDPNLVFLDKKITKERLIKEIQAKIGKQDFTTTKI